MISVRRAGLGGSISGRPLCVVCVVDVSGVRLSSLV